MVIRRTLLRAASNVSQKKVPVCWLDLRGSGLSVLERLLLEECILQHDPADRHWLICGSHEAAPHRYLRGVSKTNRNKQSSGTEKASSWNVDATGSNDSVAIVMGIGGKPDLLLNVELVRQDGVPTLKRFSGGGTVVLDYNSIWTTVIGRRNELVTEHFPRPIMEYTAARIYGPLLERLVAMQTSTGMNSGSDRGEKLTMVIDSKSCGVENTGRVITVPRYDRHDDDAVSMPDGIPSFRLRENDFVLGERKVGGNAQSIGKTGWLHHTSFLWDYDAENMDYLTLPSKRPEYRGDRSHSDFLVKLKDCYPALRKADFFAALAETCENEFAVKRVTLPDAMKIVDAVGGMSVWFDTKSRTKIVSDV